MASTISDRYDVIVIGCGIAGSLVGALLSNLERRKVLILEASSQIGGRATSFRGEAITDADKFRKTLARCTYSRVSDRSEPDLSTLINKKMLDGYILEPGGRGSWYTNRGRVSHALALFNKASVFYGNVGVVWYDHDWKPHNVAGRTSTFGWMSDEDFGEAAKVHMRKLEVGTIAEAEKLDHVPLKDWIDSHTESKAARNFHAAMGTFQTLMNDPATNAAGENIKVFLQIEAMGVHMTHGAWAFAGAPGHRFIAEGFATSVRDAGGDIALNANVRDVIIENGAATGVVAEIKGESMEIKAPVVVCTVPPKALLKLIPENLLPTEFVRLTKDVIHTAMVTGQFGLKQPLDEFCGIAVDPRSLYHTSVLISEDEGLFSGSVPLDIATISAMAPTTAPEGKHLAVMASSILGAEANDRKKVDMVIDRMLRFADHAFPGWRKALEWMLFTVGNTCILWRHPEDEWVDVKCPTVEGLYFAGDTYGKRTNQGGVDAATHSGFICASAIAGKDYLQLLPPVFR